MNIEEIKKRFDNKTFDWDDVAWLQKHKEEAIASGELRLMEFAGVPNDTIRQTLRKLKH